MTTHNKKKRTTCASQSVDDAPWTLDVADTVVSGPVEVLRYNLIKKTARNEMIKQPDRSWGS